MASMSLSFLTALLYRDPAVIFATILYGSVSLAVSFFDSHGDKQAAVAAAWARMLLRIAGVRLKVAGLDKITPDGSYVFVANHVSYMDTPVALAAIPARFRFLANDYLFRIPFLGTHLTRAGHIPVVQGKARESVRALNEAGKIIRARKISVVVFPEGGRSPDGSLGEFHEGAAFIAIKAGVPLVPVALIGMFDVLPMGSMHIQPGPVEVRIGDPVPTERLTLKDRSALTEQLRNEIARLYQGESRYAGRV